MINAYKKHLSSYAKNILVQLLKAYSPSGSEDKAVKVARSILEEKSLETMIDQAGNLLAWSMKQCYTPCMALVSHIDTVKGLIPLRVEEEGASGRGAVDAKGPLTAMMLTLMIVKSRYDVMLAALVDEEGDSLGAKTFVNNGYRPKYIIIGEPTGLSIAVSYRGSLRAQIRCKGRGGHSSAPWIGDSAFERLLKGLIKVNILSGNSVEKPSYAVTRVNAGNNDNTLPETAEATLDIRIPYGTSMESIEEVLRSIFKDCSITMIKGAEPVRVKPQDPVPRALIRAMLKNGVRPRIVHKTGTSDMNILYKYTSSIAAFGPGDSRLAHTRHEYIAYNDIVKAVLIYTDAIRELCDKRV